MWREDSYSLQMIESGNKEISRTTIYEAICMLSFPIIATNIFSILRGFIGGIMISNIEPKNAYGSANAIINSSQILIFISSSAILSSVSTLMSNVRDDDEAVTKTFRQGLWLTLFVAAPMAIFSFFFGHIISLTNDNSIINRIVQDYFYAFSLTIVASLFFTFFEQVAIGLEKKKLVFLISLLNSVITIGLCYLMVSRNFGVQSLAFSSAIGSVVSCISYAIIYARGEFAKYEFFKNIIKTFCNSNDVLCDLWSRGWRFALFMTSETLALTVRSIMVARLADAVHVLDLQNVLSQYSVFLIMLPVAMGQVSCVLISHAFAKNNEIIRPISQIILRATVAFAIVAAAFVIGFSDTFAGLFIQNFDSSLMRELLSIDLSGLCFDAASEIATGSLRGINDNTNVIYVSLGCIWVTGLSLASVLGFAAHFGITGITVGYNVGIISRSLFLLRRWCKKSTSEKLIAKKLGQEDVPNETQQKNCFKTSCAFFSQKLSKICGGNTASEQDPNDPSTGLLEAQHTN